MPKTSSEVCTEALRIIGVVAGDEPAQSEDLTRAKSYLDSIFAELNETKDIGMAWSVETVPDAVYLPLSRAVGGALASSYGRTQRAMEAAADIKPGHTLYEVGLDGVREYEAKLLNHENQVTVATYF